MDGSAVVEDGSSERSDARVHVPVADGVTAGLVLRKDLVEPLGVGQGLVGELLQRATLDRKSVV